MSNYDAVKLAAEAARNTSSVTRNLKEVAGTIKHTTTCARPFYGATGMIAFSPESHGNPINKAMPIMQIDADGKTKQVDLVWSDGGLSTRKTANRAAADKDSERGLRVCGRWRP
ncbi:hypothetical protein INP57_16350 [Saccharopolyspora sp. HNM0986]|uniref:hypothetical protein n=1 Tax=Saccharopolyspora galaxeae TaxID=2781241 RepID=UPI00190A9E6D|nr:hypothetical protein [Saccharopolyspora sp. HNM0986]MBK0868385.1 hypothetical protein [Saccharopolyspora sp. HNM0986]